MVSPATHFPDISMKSSIHLLLGDGFDVEESLVDWAAYVVDWHAVVGGCEVVLGANPSRVAHHCGPPALIYWHYPSNPPLVHSLGWGIWNRTATVWQPLKLVLERWGSHVVLVAFLLHVASGDVGEDREIVIVLRIARNIGPVFIWIVCCCFIAQCVRGL